MELCHELLEDTVYKRCGWNQNRVPYTGENKSVRNRLPRHDRNTKETPINSLLKEYGNFQIVKVPKWWLKLEKEKEGGY